MHPLWWEEEGKVFKNFFLLTTGSDSFIKAGWDHIRSYNDCKTTAETTTITTENKGEGNCNMCTHWILLNHSETFVNITVTGCCIKICCSPVCLHRALEIIGHLCFLWQSVTVTVAYLAVFLMCSSLHFFSLSTVIFRIVSINAYVSFCMFGNH